MNDPRIIAIRILVEADKAGSTLDQAIDRHAGRLAELSKRDRALANTIVFGTLRWRQQLDRVIADCSTRALETIGPEALFALRTGLYQIIYLERIPVSAAVNTAVNAVKKLSNKGAASFVNAVLRKASARHAAMPLPDRNRDPDAYISARCSLPLWLVRKWTQRYGTEATIALGDAINSVPPITLRANTLKTDRETLKGMLEGQCGSLAFTEHSPVGLSMVSPEIPIHETEAFKQGLFQVQDEAAQMVAFLLAPRPGEHVLDACAGLGGKTGHIAQIMNNQGSITAADTSPVKLSHLDNDMKRLGITIVSTRALDLLDAGLKKETGHFDRVLLDAPCTGLGVMRRNPDTKWKRTPADITRLAKQQRTMIASAADLVRPGGTLVYAVCSCEPQENDRVIEDFLAKRNDFFLDPALPDTPGIPALPSLVDKGIFRTYPAVLSMDGFFAAILKRRDV